MRRGLTVRPRTKHASIRRVLTRRPKTKGARMPRSPHPHRKPRSRGPSSRSGLRSKWGAYRLTGPRMSSRFSPTRACPPTLRTYVCCISRPPLGSQPSLKLGNSLRVRRANYTRPSRAACSRRRRSMLRPGRTLLPSHQLGARQEGTAPLGRLSPPMARRPRAGSRMRPVPSPWSSPPMATPVARRGPRSRLRAPRTRAVATEAEARVSFGKARGTLRSLPRIQKHAPG